VGQVVVVSAVLIGVIFCLIHAAILPASMAQVTLTSSVQQAGRQAACPGETVIFTCNVPDDVALQWMAGNQIPTNDPISFRPNSQTLVILVSPLSTSVIN